MTPDPFVRRIGEVEGQDGEKLAVGIDYGTVALYIGAWLSADGVRLGAAQVEELAQLIVAATWQAGAYQGDAQGRLEAGAAAGGVP